MTVFAQTIDVPLLANPVRVNLTIPAEDSTVSGSVRIQADAETAENNILGVQFYIDGNPAGAELNSQPYAFLWDTRTASNGVHKLTAKAKDGQGYASSDSILVNVSQDPAMDNFERGELAGLGPNWRVLRGNTGIIRKSDAGDTTLFLFYKAPGIAVWNGGKFARNQFSEAVLSINDFDSDSLAQVFVRHQEPQEVENCQPADKGGGMVCTKYIIFNMNDRYSFHWQSGAWWLKLDRRVDCSGYKDTYSCTPNPVTYASVAALRPNPGDNIRLEVMDAGLNFLGTREKDVCVPAEKGGQICTKETFDVYETGDALRGYHNGKLVITGKVPIIIDCPVGVACASPSPYLGGGQPGISVFSRQFRNAIVESWNGGSISAFSSDITPPSVTITSPANNAIISLNDVYSATASDNAGIVGVQFVFEDMNDSSSKGFRTAFGDEDTISPYSKKGALAEAGDELASIFDEFTKMLSTDLSGMNFISPSEISIPMSSFYTLFGQQRLWAVARDTSGNLSSTSVNVTISEQSKKFAIGDRVTAGLDVDVLDSPTGNHLGTQPLGSTGTVIDGPVTANYMYWWKIDYDNAPDGWSQEVYLFKYTPPPPPGSVKPKFTVGNRVRVTDEVNVRDNPSIVADIIGSQPAGAYGTIVGGPVEADGFWWFNLDYDNASDGWSIQDALISTTAVTPPPPPSTIDNIKPTVNIISPTAHTTISGTIAISASATDNKSVARVQFLIDGVITGMEDLSSPYSITWDSRKASNGNHSVSAYAVDSSGNRGYSPAVPVQVSNVLVPSAKFAVGDRVRVTNFINVRNNPSVTASILGTQAVDALGTVVGGPVFDSGAWWWQINYDLAPDGWSVETWLEKGLFSPPPPPPPSPSSSNFAIGQRVLASSNTEVHDNPDQLGTLIGTQTPNSAGTITDGPAYKDGFWWWKINFDNGPDGWVHESNLRKSDGTVPQAKDTPPSNKFRIRDRVQTTTLLNARSSPASSAALNGTQPAGSYGTIANGPAFRDGYWWWEVDYDNAPDGWSVENWLTLVSPPQVYTEPQCNDTIDNDGDALIDYPDDPGCLDEVDNSEATAVKPPSGDTTPPVVNIITPGNGEIISATAPVNISADATDNVAVLSVMFKIENAVIFIDKNSPYEGVYDYPGVMPDGSYTIEAVAADTSGNIATSTVTVKVSADTVPPTVSITSPLDGSTASGTILVAADATDNVKVAGVLFKLDGKILGGEDPMSPYSILWDTRTVPNGTYVLEAVARDTSNNTATSSPVTIIVNNPPPKPQCSDGVDNDTDGFIDFPQDIGCVNANDADETDNACSDGVDNDTDGFIDFPADPGCIDANDDDEINSPSGNLNNAQCIGISAPASVSTGQSFTANVIMKNTGTKWWTNTGTNPHRLGIIDPYWNTVWTANNITLPYEPVLSGQSVTFVINAKAPLAPGNYNFHWQMVQDWVEWFGGPCSAMISVAGPPDNIFPTVFITAPSSGASLTNVVNFSAQASDNIGIYSVKFYVGLSIVYGDFLAPYEYQLDTRSFSNGTYNLTAVAQDLAGNVTTSAPVTVSINNSLPPGAGFNNADCAGVVVPSSIEVNKSFNAEVRIKNTGTKQWTSSGSNPHRLGTIIPYWNTTWGVNNVPLPYSPVAANDTAVFLFTATAPSVPGTFNFHWQMVQDWVEWFGSTCYASITVTTVVSGDVIPPTVYITSPADGAIVSGTISISAQASDNVGVTSVKFLIDGSLTMEDFSAPYATIFDTTAVSDTNHVLTAVARDAAGNVAISLPVAVSVDNGESGTNNASCVGISAPPNVDSGQSFSAQVKIKNTGTKLWKLSDSTPHRLGSKSPLDNFTWGINRVSLPLEPVVANQEVLFSVNATAPLSGGAYNFNWGMIEEFVQWFGDTCVATIVVNPPLPVSQCSDGIDNDIDAKIDYPNDPGCFDSADNDEKDIIPPTASNDAACIEVSAPSSIGKGQIFSAKVTLQNTGSNSWTTDITPHRLSSQNPLDNNRWGILRVLLPYEPVPNSQSAIFSFKATAPSTVGTYPFDWRMVEENIEWFGQTCVYSIGVVDYTPTPPTALFMIGQKVQAISDVNVRSGPLNFDSVSVGYQSIGSQGTITGGPAFADNRWKWQVNFDTGPDGWAQEMSLGPVPLPPSWNYVAVKPSSKFSMGSNIITTSPSDVRVYPGLTYSLKGTQPSGTTGSVNDGPVFVGGLWWWMVNFVNNPDGWVLESGLRIP